MDEQTKHRLLQLGVKEEWADEDVHWFADWLQHTETIDEHSLRKFGKQVQNLVQWKRNTLTELEALSVITDDTELGTLHARHFEDGIVQISFRSKDDGSQTHMGYVTQDKTSGN